MIRTKQVGAWPPFLEFFNQVFMAGDDMQDQNFFSELDLGNLKTQAIVWFKKFQCIQEIFLYKADDYFSGGIKKYIVTIVAPPMPKLSQKEEYIRDLAYDDLVRRYGFDGLEKALNNIKNPELRFKACTMSFHNMGRCCISDELRSGVYKEFYKDLSNANIENWFVVTINDDPHCSFNGPDTILNIIDSKVQREVLFESPAILAQRLMEKAKGLSDIDGFVKEAENKNEPGLETSKENAELESDELKKNHDEFIKGITVRFENDTQISIQIRTKTRKNIDFTGLGFRDNGITWTNFLSVLKSPPNYYWELSKESERQQIRTVSKRLVEWINRTYNTQLPKGYKLYRLNKAAGKGIYEFTFNIEYAETDSASKISIKNKFDRLVEKFNNENNPAKKSELEEKIIKIANQGIASKALSNEDVQNAIASGRDKTHWDKLERENFKHE